MFSAQLHPEFGYFGPSASVRRVCVVALVLAVFGLVAGAGSIRSMLGHGSDSDTAAMPARAMQAAETEWVAPPEIPTRLPRPQLTAGSANKPDVAKSDPAKACEEMTWAYLDGKCVAGKTRKPRVVRVPTHRPAIALIPLGRHVSAGTDMGASKAAARAPEARDAKPTAGKSAKAADADTNTASSTPGTTLQAFATAKKPQRTAQHRTRRSTRSAAYNTPWVRQSRADGWGWGGTRYSGWSW